jgi:hypothetical protein
MDREFTWNRVEPNETPSYGKSRQAEVDEIKSKIEALKAERAQLVAQLGDEYSDERLGAQMLRAGDEGAMYKFLRGQQDQMKLNAAENAKNSKPTQEEFDKLLETLQATAASIEDPKLDPRVKERYGLMLGNYRSRLNEMLAKNPSLSMRNYNPQGDEGGNAGGVGGGELWQLENKLGWSGSGMTDAEIDAEAAKLKNKPNVSSTEVNKIVEDAKKRNETAYQKYVGEVERKNAEMKKIYDAYAKTTSAETRSTLETLLGDYLDRRTNNFKKKKALTKDKWVKGK